MRAADGKLKINFTWPNVKKVISVNCLLTPAVRFCVRVSYFTDPEYDNSQTRLINTRRLVFTIARELVY